MLRAAALPHFSWRSSLLSREQSCRPFSYTSRRHNGPKASDVTKKYSDTLLLPKTTFPLYGDPEKSEVAFRQKTSDELYRWQWENAKGPLFVVHDGPPYANGDIHMGHALNKVIKDMIGRYYVSRGHRVHYVPGWDCHGLPIENKVLEKLGKEADALSPNAIREQAHALAHDAIASQKAAFRKMGVMADWDNVASTYRTLDHDYEIRQLRVFQKMVENGLIYRDYRPVHWSPSSRSALAEAELDYQDDHVSHSVYVSFRVDAKSEAMGTVLREIVSGHDTVHLIVWTTTPWTLTANMGIAVNPELMYAVLRQEETGRVVIVAKDLAPELASVLGPTTPVADVPGTDLLGLEYHPVFSSTATSTRASAPYRVIAAPYVTASSGTGLVHTAPAHGGEDYATFRTLGLLSRENTMLCHVNDDGQFDAGVKEVLGDKGDQVIGKDVLDTGSRAIVDLLKEAGALLKVKRIKHKYPYDWKTKKPIIMRATSQWFANLDSIKYDAQKALKEVAFHPPQSRNRLESFVRERSEWCISRQRVWGAPIPALYHLPTGRAVMDEESLTYIIGVLEAKGTSHWWDGPVADFVPRSLLVEGEDVETAWKKGTDTMDVWFDSGSSWSMLTHLDGQEDRKHHADVCVEGSDQHRGWFQSQLLTAVGASTGARAAPYRGLITHGMVLDEKGKKMSKSVGNVVDPMVVVEGGKDRKKEPAYGAEALRLWAATVEYWSDMALGPKVLAQTAEALRKIRNSARFMLGNMGADAARGDFVPVKRSDMSLADKYVVHELYKLEQVALQAYPVYNFPKVVNVLSNFANITMSSLYLDIVKDVLYADATDSLRRRAIVTTLEKILTTMTNVMGPILPHLAEEIHFTRQGGEDRQAGLSVFTRKWEEIEPVWNDPMVEIEMNSLLRVRSAVLNLLERARSSKQLRSALEAEVDIILPNDVDSQSIFVQLLHREQEFLKTLFIVSDVTVVDTGSLGTSSHSWEYTDSILVPGTNLDIAIRVRPASNEKCPRCWTYTRPAEDELCGRCSSVLPH